MKKQTFFAIHQSSSSPSSFSPITCIGSSVRTREYHAPRDRDAVGVAVSSIAPAPSPCARARSFIVGGDASDALRPDVAYSVIRKTMCVYSKNAILLLLLLLLWRGICKKKKRGGVLL